MSIALPIPTLVAPVTVRFTAAAGWITESPVRTKVVPAPSRFSEATVELISSVTVGAMVCAPAPICTLLVDVGTPPDQLAPLLQNPAGGGLFHVSVCANVAEALKRITANSTADSDAHLNWLMD